MKNKPLKKFGNTILVNSIFLFLKLGGTFRKIGGMGMVSPF